ncbi:thioesterase family protein [Victivallis sp. Marseille-Q1083]|uniref:acyl-CoA thioesterase n=1 Tax=Victivallis sp. Marseille-Q1083 TaxID=2717288 RepID=UPI00158F6094|nr:thioesterase family protein [Victivallis sp. Marseille-Q1083]
MHWHESFYRVPYADTDQMGVVYYANYLEYFERSRTEMLREAGLPYSALERCNCFLPVTEVNCRYLSPAHYDELLTFRSGVAGVKGVRLKIITEIRHEATLLVRGEVTLACMNRDRKLIRPPVELLTACEQYRVEE